MFRKVASFRGSLGLGLLILLSSLFMRQVYSGVAGLVPDVVVGLLLWLVLAVGIALALWRAGAIFPSFSKGHLAVLSLLAIAFGASLLLEIREEKMHILLFGMLGFVLALELSALCGDRFLYVGLVACSLGGLFGLFDEVVQYFLPYRVGDVRDVVFNFLSVLWGVLLWSAVRLTQHEAQSA